MWRRSVPNLSARKDYYRNGADGKPLPYLDKLIYLDLGQDSAAQVAALRSGQVDDIFNPSAEIWQAVKDVPEIAVYSVDTGQTFVIRMRADVKPWDDVKVRQALKKCFDRQKMLDLAWFGEGVLGIDAHVAPVHPEYCPKDIPAYDPEGSKKLLAEAGYPDGLEVELTTQEARAEPAMAQALKESAIAGGFNVKLNIVAIGGLLERLDGGAARHHHLGAPPAGHDGHVAGLHGRRRRQARRVERVALGRRGVQHAVGGGEPDHQHRQAQGDLLPARRHPDDARHRGHRLLDQAVAHHQQEVPGRVLPSRPPTTSSTKSGYDPNA